MGGVVDAEHDLSREEKITALKDLLQSTGWQLFLAHAKDTWGPVGYSRAIQQALSTIPHNSERPYEIARVTEQVHATAEALNRFVSWPGEQIRQLTTEKSTQPFAGLRRMGR